MGLWVWRVENRSVGLRNWQGVAGQHCKVHVLLPLLVLNTQLG